jgi:hypothetical protein
MRATAILSFAGAIGLLAACNNEAAVVQRAAAGGTSCPADKVEVRETTNQYKGQLNPNVAVFEANVCGGGWRQFCLKRGVNYVSEGLDECLSGK